MKGKFKLELIVFIIMVLIFITFKLNGELSGVQAVETNSLRPFHGIMRLQEEIYQQEIYILPEEISIEVQGETIKDRVIWDKIAVTDTPGSYMYEGYTLNYSYNVNLTLKVKENVYDRKIGYVRNIFTNESNELVIEFDSIEFFQGEQALKEAIKDNEVEVDDCGNFINSKEYYIRNSSYDKEIYKINKFPTFKLMEIEFNDEQKGALNLVKVDFDLMKRYIDNYNNCDDENKLLFCIDL